MTCAESVLPAVTAHARSEAPRECCGILLGVGDRIVEARPARNLSDDANRFVIDPRDHFVARRHARAGGAEVVGFYHSHPRSEAAPSATDVAEVTYDHCVYLIVSLMAEPHARLFRMDPGGPCELELRIEEGSSPGSTLRD